MRIGKRDDMVVAMTLATDVSEIARTCRHTSPTPSHGVRGPTKQNGNRAWRLFSEGITKGKEKTEDAKGPRTR